MVARSLRMLGALLIAGFVSAGALDAQQPLSCPEGRAPTGDLGIAQLRCSGSACAVSLRDESGYYHDFTVEPRIGALAPDTPGAELLRVGDVIAAIDDVPITTRAGGRRLANLVVGQPVTLTVRREGRLMRLELRPVRGCNMPGLRVRITSGDTARLASLPA